MPFEDIRGTRSGVEQIKQTLLYTRQQPEWSCQLSSAEDRREWILQMFMYLTFSDYHFFPLPVVTEDINVADEQESLHEQK